jgi:hypothetical protein
VGDPQNLRGGPPRASVRGRLDDGV